MVLISLGIILAAGFPIWFSVFHFHEYLNLRNGNVIKESSVFGFICSKSEEETRLSRVMLPYSKELPDVKLLIRKKHGFLRFHLRNADCYTELSELCMKSESGESDISLRKIMGIINKYIE